MYPNEFRLYSKQPKVKKVFVSDIKYVNGTECQNCGGAGIITIFCSLEGPYQTPTVSGRTTDSGMAITSHYEKSIDGWWNGVTYSHSCPKCNGLGRRHTTYTTKPTQEAMKGVL